jgi:indolepyruvate ferredoxin oxidoreductase, beta subunit
MDGSVKQQIIISGVGGQGILFITRLLAEAAIKKELPVLTSETHGMAQRGGTVVSHFKVGEFSSPLIRPKQADGLLALKKENIMQYRAYLRDDAWAVVNSNEALSSQNGMGAFAVDADGLSRQIGNPRAVNLLVMGFAMARLSKTVAGRPKMFCNIEDIKSIVAERLAGNQKLSKASLHALEVGYQHPL